MPRTGEVIKAKHVETMMSILYAGDPNLQGRWYTSRAEMEPIFARFLLLLCVVSGIVDLLVHSGTFCSEFKRVHYDQQESGWFCVLRFDRIWHTYCCRMTG